MLSLLWPAGPPASSALGHVSDQALGDLELDRLAERLAQDRPDRRQAVRVALAQPPRDAATVRWRAEVSLDLLEHPARCDALQAALGALRRMGTHRPQAFAAETPRAARVGARVVELESYLESLTLLAAALEQPSGSRALDGLRQQVRAELERAEVVALREELPRWRRTLDEIRSVTVGINVSPELEPEGAAVLGFSSTPVGAGEMALERLVGSEQGRRGLVHLGRREPVDWQGQGPLATELKALLEAVATPVERALHSFRVVQAQGLAHLENELVLLLGAARLARRWRSLGLPVTVAQVGSPWRAEDAYHPLLAEQLPPSQVVRNGVCFGPEGAVWILTGPNRSGKTTYLRLVGLLQVLGQCGLPVPAASLTLEPCDQLLTHFPVPEAALPGQGRLDEEAGRIAEIFAHCTPASLVLLNEVLSGTSAPEGVALAADILRGFRVLGARVVYATHLHELATRVAEINASVRGPGAVASLTVQSTHIPGDPGVVRRPTYRVVPGPPDPASFFASHIARQHGISLPQLLEGLKARGVLPDGEAPG